VIRINLIKSFPGHLSKSIPGCCSKGCNFKKVIYLFLTTFPCISEETFPLEESKTILSDGVGIISFKLRSYTMELVSLNINPMTSEQCLISEKSLIQVVSMK
jgi:hypothetical protein